MSDLMARAKARRESLDAKATELENRVQARMQQMEDERKAQEQAKRDEELRIQREAEEELKRMEEAAEAERKANARPKKEVLAKQLSALTAQKAKEAEQEAEARWLKQGVATGKFKFGFSKSHIKVVQPKPHANENVVWEVDVPMDLISSELGHWSDDDDEDYDENGLPKISDKNKKKTFKKRFLGVSHHYLKDDWAKGDSKGAGPAQAKKSASAGRLNVAAIWNPDAKGDDDAAAAERKYLEMEARKLEVQNFKLYLKSVDNKELTEADKAMQAELEARRQEELAQIKAREERIKAEAEERKRMQEMAKADKERRMKEMEEARKAKDMNSRSERERAMKEKEEQEKKRQEELSKQKSSELDDIKKKRASAIAQAEKEEAERKKQEELEKKQAAEAARKADHEKQVNKKVERAKLRFNLDPDIGTYQFSRPGRSFLGMRHFLLVPKEQWVKSKLKELADKSVGLSKVALATFTDVCFLSYPTDDGYQVLHMPVQRKGVKVAMGPAELEGSFFCKMGPVDYLLMASDKREAMFWCKTLTVASGYIPTDQLQEDAVVPKY